MMLCRKNASLDLFFSSNEVIDQNAEDLCWCTYHFVLMLTDIYRNEPPRRRECLYFLGVGHYKLTNYAEARRYNSTYNPSSLVSMPTGSLLTIQTNDRSSTGERTFEYASSKSSWVN